MPGLTALFVRVGAAAVITALIGTALATPPSGIVSGTVVARAGFVDSVDLKFKITGADSHEIIRAPELQETVMQQIVIAPGGSTGWHSHPGPVVVLIKTGQLTVYSSEDPTHTPHTYSAGEAFVESGQGLVQIAFNLGSQNVELWATYFDVPPGGAFRLDAPQPENWSF